MSKPNTTEYESTQNTDGEFRRKPTSFHDTIGSDAYPAAGDRYHLYVSLACPWAHRTLIARALKGLQDALSVDVVDHFMDDEGWSFFRGADGATGDRVHGHDRLSAIYFGVEPGYTGRYTVPILYDKATSRIVNNESSEIIRMFDHTLDAYAQRPDLDFYPQPLRARIDAVNEWVYPKLNNGVYRSGFANTQQAYERAVNDVFSALEDLEAILTESRWLAGNRFTEADIRAFTTLVRFDVVYHTHFKCNHRRLRDFPNVWAFTREIFQHPLVRPTVDFTHIKQHYYASHTSVNPRRIVPVGPVDIDWDEPHGRQRLGGQGLAELVP